MALTKQLEDVQLNLNKSYEKLEYHKETLIQQADRVKEQINNNFAMQIEAFNQRKNWLFNQLELVKWDKMDSIQRQQDAVKCSMINIKKIMSDPNKYTNIQIKEELESFNNLLSEETRPFLAFRSDSAALREIISQYGGIMKQYSGHFADPTRPSVSLPRVVEEEDDEESLSFVRKYESQNKDDQNVLYISKHPTNSSIVKAWLMTTTETNDCNNFEMEFETLNSEHDSFVCINSSDSLDTKKTKNELTLPNECKELWLPKHYKFNNKNYSDETLTPFINTVKPNKKLWLLDSNLIDDEKDVDHCDLINKACKKGTCKNFFDCSEIENCCHRLLNPNKPSWNKWLIDNEVINNQLINTSAIDIMPRDMLVSKFSNVLNSDNEKWLDKKKCKRRLNSADSKNFPDTGMWLCNKMSKIDCCFNNSAFNLPLEKWIGWGREQDWTKNKESITDFVDKSIEKITLDDVDGLINGKGCKTDVMGIDCNKWLASR